MKVSKILPDTLIKYLTCIYINQIWNKSSLKITLKRFTFDTKLRRVMHVFRSTCYYYLRRAPSIIRDPLAQLEIQPGSFKTKLGACGPLVDGPDYTFVDGRPTPLANHQRRRMNEQRELAVKVLKLMDETQFAIDREQRLNVGERSKREATLAAKLKPKGHLLKQS
ncbi:unnamed protein product, partial [Meganyctiphanes norvegica]